MHAADRVGTTKMRNPSQFREEPAGPAAAPANPLPRWRGFNLLDLFKPGDSSGTTKRGR